MSADSIVSVAWDVFKGCVVVPIKRGFDYVISSKSFADGLREEVQNLENDAARVHILEIEARNNVRSFHITFTDWKARAEKDSREARELLDTFDEESKTCCYGTLPDPCCRYQFSRKAEGRIEVIKRLAQECSRFKELNDICFIGPARGNVTAPNPARREGKDVIQLSSIKLGDDGVFESRAAIIRDIMVALADDSNSVVGVHGMGGVGKSTLLVDAERRIKEEKSFDWVAKADVSENPDIQRIQQEIGDALGLGDIKNTGSVSGRAELLRRRLEYEEREKKKVLIILDNLWEGLDLNKVGIPCGHDNKVIGCKLLLTSRNRDVLQTEMGCDEPFRLGGLLEEEARRLFERYVGDNVRDDKFKPLVDEALHKCAGLPFLIVQMVKLLKHADLSGWKNVLKQLKLSKNEGIGEKINEMLQLSFKNLKDAEKSLLALCVAYGTSKPSLENLVRYGVGWGLFREDDNMEEARESFRLGIRTLQASSLLLEDGEAYDFKIHDLVREFVASVASKDHPLLVLKDKDKSITDLPKDKLKSCQAICFPYVDMEEVPQELNCPELQIFLLFCNNKSLEVPDSYFNSMRKLTVLNLTRVRLTRSLTPFQFSENLHTLCLQHCSLENVAILGKLKGLKILSIVDSEIERLPKEIGQLVELRLLDLSHCSQLEIIEPGVLRSLTKLEELYMVNSFQQWNAVEQTTPTNAGLIELNHMKNLRTLLVSIPNPSVLPKDLNIEKLTMYRIRIGEAWRGHRHWSEYKGSRTLQLKLKPTSDILQKERIQSILRKTDDLFLHELNGIEQSICQLSLESFSQLKHLCVKDSPSVRYILEWSSLPAFKALETLLLKNLVNFEKICHNHISTKSFSTLKVVRVMSCDKMEVLFPRSLVRQLPQLEEIEVDSCKLMQGIVEADDCGKIELSKLRVLKLCHLPNIKNFFTTGSAPSTSTSDDQVGTQIAFFNGQQVSLQSLESLTMEGLSNLKEIWSDESPLELSNLRSLKVAQCKSILKVISSRSPVKLHKLHTLCIRGCNLVQEIFDLDRPSDSGDIETSSELTTLELNKLGSLRHIWNKNPCGIVSFHNLKKLQVDHCDSLRFMFFPSMVKSLTQLGDLRVRHCNMMKAIITEKDGLEMEISETLAFPMLTNLCLKHLKSLTCFSSGKCSQEAWSQDRVQSCSTVLFNKEVSLPSLESLTIERLPNLKEIWSDDSPLELTNLQSLEVAQCESLLKVINSRSLLNLHKLHTLCIGYCNSVQEIFDLDGPSAIGDVKTLSELTTLKLNKLGSLRHIWNKNPCGIVSFHNLKKLEVNDCDNLGFMFFPSMVKSLAQLRDLTVSRCEKMHAVIMEEEGLEMEVSETLAFPMLTNLCLKYLESLTCFSRGKCSREARSQYCVQSRSTALFNREVAFPILKTLYICGMDNIEMIWDNQVAVDSFTELKSLFVDECSKVVTVVPSFILGRLLCLESLRAEACGSLEVVFELQPLNPLDGHPVVLPLKELTVSTLPKLKCMG